MKAQDWLGQAVLCHLCTILGRSRNETYYANVIWDERIAGFQVEKHAKLRSAILEYDPEMTNTKIQTDRSDGLASNCETDILIAEFMMNGHRHMYYHFYIL